jgi:cytosine/uracil/thiamine/allantoin permease
MAVAFDWGLTVQMLLMPVLSIFYRSPLLPGGVKLDPKLAIIISFPIFWLIAFLFVLFGEGIRRGVRWTRPIQIVGMKAGNYWPLVAVVILCIFSPLIAWRLSRPETARWFATVTSAEARKRHGGSWIWKIALWSIVGGTLQALSVFH